MDAGHQINERRTSVKQHKDQRKGYSIPMKGLHGEHWYGETGDRTGSKTPSQTSVNPAAQAYMVGRVQLSNSQKLAERLSPALGNGFGNARWTGVSREPATM